MKLDQNNRWVISAKISASYFEGYVFLDYLSWENFNESKYLIEQVEKYYQYRGYYPESIHVDKIYRTRENRKYCREKGITLRYNTEHYCTYVKQAC